jgi:hypothetical protein
LSHVFECGGSFVGNRMPQSSLFISFLAFLFLEEDRQGEKKVTVRLRTQCSQVDHSCSVPACMCCAICTCEYASMVQDALICFQVGHCKMPRHTSEVKAVLSCPACRIRDHRGTCGPPEFRPEQTEQRRDRGPPAMNRARLGSLRIACVLGEACSLNRWLHDRILASPCKNPFSSNYPPRRGL